MLIVHLTGSPFFGGPERLMFGLARSLQTPYRCVFALFADHGNSHAFRHKLVEHGLETITLIHDTPQLLAMVREIARQLRKWGADLVCCHGYKADIAGLLAARYSGVPAIAMSHGWTAGTWKVRGYELVDRMALRWMDRVVCVSKGQAEKVRSAGVPAERVSIIRNAVQAERFDHVDPAGREELLALFPDRPERVVGSAGRLSVEKGFGVLVEAAALVKGAGPRVGFVHFGDGPLREPLRRRIGELGLERRFILAGHCTELDRLLPHWDLSVLPSFTEGLPTVALESYAAGVPVVATAVGGTPEAVSDGVDGYLVPPGDANELARRIADVLEDESKRREMGRIGRERIRADFAFDAQAVRFQRVCDQVLARRGPPAAVGYRTVGIEKTR
jgi:glycosyltransferase involved in cell wall biosynthesis